MNNVSLGDYAEIVQSEAYRDAKLGTTAKMLPRLLGPNATPFDLRFLGPHGRTFRVDSGSPVAAGIDGEAAVLEPPATARR